MAVSLTCLSAVLAASGCSAAGEKIRGRIARLTGYPKEFKKEVTLKP